jgi:hypothetical protein
MFVGADWIKQERRNRKAGQEGSPSLLQHEMFSKADRCLRPVPGGDDEDIVDDKEWETGQRQIEVAQIELPGAESDDEDDDNDLYEGEDSFHFLLSSPLRQVWMGNGLLF